MKKIIALAAAVMMLWITSNDTLAQSCQTQQEEKVLVIGDSWPDFMTRVYGTYAKVFEKYGFPDVKEKGNLTTLSGSRAQTWVEPDNLSTIISEAQNSPSLEVALIILGGNDLIGDWDVSNTPQEEQALIDRIQNDLQTIIDSIHSVRPDMEILLGSYDYMNFIETINDWPSSFIFPENPFKGNWDGMGNPDHLTVNSKLGVVARMKIAIANGDARVHYVNCYGLNQYVYGYPTPFPLPPGGTFPPESTPLPGQAPDYDPILGGDTTYSGPPVAQGPIPPGGTLFAGFDPIHMSEDAYMHYASFQFEHYFFNKFRGRPEASYTSVGGSEDGWVDAAGNMGTGEIRMGAKANGSGSIAGIISFDTESIPDNANITEARLFLSRKGVSGDNPFNGNFGDPTIDISNGDFGTAAIEATDYDVIADGNAVGCFIGNAGTDDGLIRIELDANALNHINKTGTTQFRVYFPGGSGGSDSYVAFHNGDDVGPFAKPILDVEYEQGVGIATSENQELSIVLFPNPAKEQLNINLTAEKSAKATVYVRNMLGQDLIVLNWNLNIGRTSEVLDISSFPTGVYFITAEVDGVRSTKRFVVEQ